MDVHQHTKNIFDNSTPPCETADSWTGTPSDVFYGRYVVLLNSTFT